MVIAAREYQAAVRTKSFLISLLILPVMMGGSVLIQLLLKDHVDTEEKRFAIVDRTPGQHFYEQLKAAADKRNQETKPVFDLVHVEPSASERGAMDRQRVELSDQVRDKRLFGFLEIGPDVAQAKPKAKDGAADDERSILRYQSNSPTYDTFKNWADEVLKIAIQEQRLAGLKTTLSTQDFHWITQPVPLHGKGLSKWSADGTKIEDAQDENQIASFLVPFGLMMLMFMMVLIGATPLMQGVVEEKMQRIAEVLLGSVQPFQLMMGKLIGMVGVSFTLSAIYLGGAYWAAYRYELTQFISPELLAWFVVFQALAVLMYGSLFIAIGAACTDMRETQSMMWPVMLLVTLPMFVWVNVVREPNGAFATWASFFPFATPLLMILRQAVPPGIPAWQLLLGVALVLATTTGCVYAGGRIFRVGILMQGKGARAGDLVKWVFRG
jgi:ABC-2 type transport system permease protein